MSERGGSQRERREGEEGGASLTSMTGQKRRRRLRLAFSERIKVICLERQKGQAYKKLRFVRKVLMEAVTKGLPFAHNSSCSCELGCRSKRRSRSPPGRRPAEPLPTSNRFCRLREARVRREGRRAVVPRPEHVGREAAERRGRERRHAQILRRTKAQNTTTRAGCLFSHAVVAKQLHERHTPHVRHTHD